MTNARLNRWSNVLVAVAGSTVGFGVALVFLGPGFLNALYLDAVDPVFWGGPVPEAAVAFQRFTYAVLGATIVGLGLMVGAVAHFAVRRGELWASASVIAAVLGWYTLDTALSAWCGVWMNVAVNTVFAAALLAPTLKARGAARETRSATARL